LDQLRQCLQLNQEVQQDPYNQSDQYYQLRQCLQPIQEVLLVLYIQLDQYIQLHQCLQLYQEDLVDPLRLCLLQIQNVLGDQLGQLNFFDIQ
jgi:hypothetical protein